MESDPSQERWHSPAVWPSGPYFPPSIQEKLYLKVKWIRVSFAVNSLVKLSRRPHCSSLPIITPGTGVKRRFAVA